MRIEIERVCMLDTIQNRSIFWTNECAASISSIDMHPNLNKISNHTIVYIIYVFQCYFKKIFRIFLLSFTFSAWQMGPSSKMLSNARHAVVPNVAIKQKGIRPFSWSSLIAVLSVSPRKLSMKSTVHVWYYITINSR